MKMQRIYQLVIEQHFNKYTQMLFLAGPRQVGKTTLCENMMSSFKNSYYYNFDIEKDRQLILQGETAIANACAINTLTEDKPLLILDELHKYKHWKALLKGLYDQFKSKIYILVTGSAKLDIYKKGGDSLMGRYLLYRIHPLSVAEILNQPLGEFCIHQPRPLPAELWHSLIQFGGYPDPFLHQDLRFSRQWHRLRMNQLFREEIRSLKQIQDIPHIEMLAKLLKSQSGQLINYSKLAVAVRVSTDTIIRWINILEAFYYCFRIRPWYQNVKRSLVKEPKVYLWDWSDLENPGIQAETLIACHLHKAIHFWTDHGLGDFELFFLRDKEGHEVDFIVTKNNAPWFLVEVKHSENQGISKELYYFQDQLNAPHAFQVVLNMPFIQKDCFIEAKPIIVPAITFLSQLV